MADGSNPDRACDRCRDRRVKCDKRHPDCLRCEKLGKPCPGYAKKRKFVDESASLRRKYEDPSQLKSSKDVSYSNTPPDPSASVASSLASPTSSEPGRRAGTSGQWYHSGGLSNGSSATNTSLAIAQPSSSIQNITPPHFATKSEDGTFPNDAVVGITNEFMPDAIYDPQWFDLDPAAFYRDGDNSCGFLPNAPNIVDEIDKQAVRQGHDSSDTPNPEVNLVPPFENELMIWGNESQFQTSSILSDEREHEMAYLVRHFSETIAPWMDLFDCESSFSRLVPLKALHDVLLKFAIAAVAARQLGKVKGNKPFTPQQSQKPAAMEIIDVNNDIDWFYKAANYYDKALVYSRKYLAALSGPAANPPTPITAASLAVGDTNDVLLATSIFSLYEYLDNVDMGWLKHLKGMRAMLRFFDPAASISSPSETALSHSASFWNFVRSDYQTAYMNSMPTLLDPDDTSMWLNFGLQLQTDGRLYIDPNALARDKGALCATNQLVAHTLLWIALRAMNYLFQPQASTKRQALWHEVSGLLDAWQAAKPASFQPCAKLRHPIVRRNGVPSKYTDNSCIAELFFSIPLCAAAVQLYHFVRLLVALNKPPAPSPRPPDSTSVYRSDEALTHAYTIVGIALGRPQLAVRIEMLLPLYLAGQCLEVAEERQVVVDLLRAIELDTGCETSDRIKELIKRWGWEATA